MPPIAPAIIDTILGHLAVLFLAGSNGDLGAARLAAGQMLAAYQAETPDELRLAAEIISFGLHALEALGQAAAPDLSLPKVMRLRGSAVSLSREGHKAQRKLDQLQRARRTEKPAPQATQPQIDHAAGLLEFMRDAMGAPANLKQRNGARRISANLRKNAAAFNTAAETLAER